ncbi:MAG: SpoIIE family protein phosphatase [Actinomycetota bacterium]|nr:SpoIIE family protein phosphatase [Actinomycetota bacterium]
MIEARESSVLRSDEIAAPSSRRWLPLLALVALVLFAAVGGALAWRQYRSAQRTDLNDARAKAVVAATVFDTAFKGEIATLQSISKAPVVVSSHRAGMLAYFKRVQPKNGTLFTGGLAWIDGTGKVRVSTNGRTPGPVADVSDRAYFRSAIRTGQPFVSAGLTARRSHRQVIVIALPTRDLEGDVTGVLAGTLLVKPPKPSTRAIDLGYSGLAILDRENQLVLSGFAHPRTNVALRRLGKATSGVLSDVPGLDGESGHVVAFARATVPQWSVILDRPRSEIFGDARRNLLIELALTIGAALFGLALLAWILVRARAESRALGEQARRRRLRYEQEHAVAITLQRSLLSAIPPIPNVDSAARYQAGSTGLEVGGDWYDVLERPDGIVHISVGDVAGRGVAAAALMGQLRNAFRAYAYDHTSPAQIMWRLIRHMGEDEMATAVCITIDPASRRLTYASAGHPPPLLRDDDVGSTTRLDLAQAPPLGFASPDAVSEAEVALPRRATLLAYTDGVIERRDRVIDEGIERLETAFRSADRGLSADELADTLIREVAVVTAADDDIALLVLRLPALPAPAEPELAASGDADISLSPPQRR